MSKNSPKQNVQAVKEWMAFMKFKPKKKSPPTYNNTLGEFFIKPTL